MSAEFDDRYTIHLDDKYGQMALVDVAGEMAANEPWFNQTLTAVNDAVVRLGVIEGDFHWHKHDDTDEFFLVLEGELLLDIEEGETVALQPHQGFTVPRGVVHRTRAPRRTSILMVEREGVAPTGD
ncbi:MAG TPA: cupin domain-containing protein [Thermoleophilaceae bacterium]|nr:cupin domain-containing protein [Thermoleophilaceae bacterium]